MKKLKGVIISVLISIFIINIVEVRPKAEDEGYYIKNMQVDVEVNDKRQFFITETIDVYFNEDRHGIKRDITTSSGTEDCSISDISVIGAPFESTKESGNVSLKIGDEDETIDGDKRYIIKYTLNYYDDEEVDGDYIYLNLLPNWDTRVENFRANITYPKEGKLENITLTDGEYGSKENKLSKYTVKDNEIIIESTKEIKENNGITINARLEEGTFKNVKERKYPFNINKEIVNIKITKEKEYLVEREFEIKVTSQNYDFGSNEIKLWDDNKYDKVSEISCDNSQFKVSEKYSSIYVPKEVGVYKVKVSYKVRPRLADDIYLSLKSNNYEGKIDNLIVNVESEVPIENALVNFLDRGIGSNKDRYTLDRENKKITFNNTNTIYPREKVFISLDCDNSLFKREMDKSEIKTIVLSLIVAIISGILFLVFKEKRRYEPELEFYPPDGMNSAELAYAYKNSCTPKDITSLIYLWASEGHLEINFDENNEFKLIKISELDSEHKKYEKTLFKGLFKKGNEVTEAKLRNGELENKISSAINSVQSAFKGKRKKLTDAKSRKISVVLLFLSFVPMVSFYISAKYTSNLTPGDVMGLSLISAGIISVVYTILYALNVNNLNRIVTNKAKLGFFIALFIYLLSASIIVLIFKIGSHFITNIVVVISIFSIITMAGLLPKRSEYGRMILEKILGFRKFLETAEKERLEALLEENPNYFYNILPYAQVLNITDKWANRFEGIEVDKSPYYTGYTDLNSYTMMRIISTNMNSVSDTVGSHNTSSFDGGFSGGGFSGGGTGGGSGSSW